MPNWYDIRKSPAGQVGGMALKGLLNLQNPLGDVPPEDLDSPYAKLNYPEQRLPKAPPSPVPNIAKPLGPISQFEQPPMAVSHMRGIRPVSSHTPMDDFLRQDPTFPTEDSDTNQRADQIIKQSRVSNFTPPTQKTTSSSGPEPHMGMGVLSSMPRGALDAPDDALAALRGMGANQGLQLAGLQEGRASEMKRNLDLQQRFPDQIWAGATPSDVSGLERDIKQNPYSSQNAAARQFEDIAMQREAQAGGFRSPQEAAESARQMEMYKLQSPERVAGIEQQGALERQREMSRGNLAVTESKGAQQENFLDMLRQQALAGGNISRVSAPGGGSVSYTPEQQIPPVLLNQLSAARAALETAKTKQGHNFWNTDITGPAQNTFNQYWQAVLARHPAPPDVKEWVNQVVNNPQTANMPLDQLLSDPQYAEGAPTEAELHWMNQLLSLYRGK